MSRDYWMRNWMKYLAGVAIAFVVMSVFFYLTFGCDGNETPPVVMVQEEVAKVQQAPEHPLRKVSKVERNYHYGVKLYNLRAYEDARHLLNKYVEEKGKFEARPMAYLILGEIERALTNHCGSLPYYEHALKYGGPYVRHHAGVNLVYACLRCDAVDRAEEVAQQLMDDTEVRFRKADVGANDDIVTARAIVYRRRGHDYANRGGICWVLAVDEYSKALKLRPDFVDVACDKAWAYMRASQARWYGTGKVAGADGMGDVVPSYDDCMIALVIAWDTLHDPRYARFKEGRCADLRVEVGDEIVRQYGLVTGRWGKTYKNPRHTHIAEELARE